MHHPLEVRMAIRMADSMARGPLERAAWVRFLLIENPTLEDALDISAASLADRIDEGLVATAPSMEHDYRWERVVRRWESKHKEEP